MKKAKTGTTRFSNTLSYFILSVLFLAMCAMPAFAGGNVSIWTTDSNGNPKSDFAPGDIVYLRGSGFEANRPISVFITRPDGAIESCDLSSCNTRFLGGLKFSDPEGYFVYQYDLDGITGEYGVYVSDENNSATIGFTDSRTITSATLNGGSSTAVYPSASITASVTVFGGGSGDDNWRSTKYTIEGQTAVCVNTPDHSSGFNTES